MIVGKRISDRYKIVKLIGGGGMSNVYLAHDMILNRDVAIKILRYDFSNEEDLHRRFQREALSATSLTHPNIVSIYDVGEDGDMHYIVMEYIKGKTLKQYIQEFSPLSPARSVYIMKQLTSAIAHAHDNGIIHRDIKPQNILMDSEGNVKVTDFGIATTINATSYTQTNSVIGTVHYLSPEQARGGTATKKSDIYALGIVLYELLTGELPFSGESAVSIALKHLQSETPSVRAFDATIPQSVENIVNKATAKDPLHRYQSAEELEEDLDTCLSVTRINEDKFLPPVDEDETKLIPIIKEPKPLREISIKSEKEEQPKTPQSTKKPQKKKRGKKWIIMGFVVLLLLIVLAVYLMTPNKIEVPDVANLTLDEASEMIEEAGFVVGETEERNHEEIEEGKVIETKPSGGLEREKGTTIDFIVSIGEEKSEMTDYTGSQIEQVKSILDNRGFAEIKEEYIFSNEAEGTILEQEPVAGEEIIAKNTTIVFKVSKGKNMNSVADLTGFNKSALDGYKRSSGFNINIKGEEHSETQPEGSVVSQSPVGGKQLEAGGTISVVLSKGPAEKLKKFYSKTVEIPYEPLEEGMEETVRVYILDKTNSMAEPVDEFTITKTTSYRIELEIEEGNKGAYRIILGSTTIEEATIPYDDPKLD